MDPLWEMPTIIENIRSFMLSGNFLLIHIPRSNNEVADWVARAVIKKVLLDWVSNHPSRLSSLVGNMC
ncbi:hypothetical protein LguiB_016196 [Lonicera macranthoides]